MSFSLRIHRIIHVIGNIVESRNLQLFHSINHSLLLRSFSTARAVFHHACSAHVKYSLDHVCLWNGCERIKRQKWALISHVQVH